MARPSGIQRLSYELYDALQRSNPGAIGFARHDMRRDCMVVTDWAEVQQTFLRMTAAQPPAPTLSPDTSPALMHSPLTRVSLLRAAAQRMPREVRQPLGDAIRAQLSVVRNLARAARALPAALSSRGRRQSAAGEGGSSGNKLVEVARPGDTLASFGSPWSLPDYPGQIARLRASAGMRYSVLIYDMIPVVRPEYCDRGLVAMFSRCTAGIIPQADTILAISQSSVRDINEWATREGVALRSTPKAIPIGTGFGHAAPADTLPGGLVPGGYALFVSTIEARKNHVLAFRAWRRLLDELGPKRVPTLVFAGRVGWMVADLMQQIHNARHLGGKLVLVENPDDATLAALYRGARFTLFPSLYEGWGLPVSESLAFGKVCLASNSTSVPEAGGEFCLYHDPDSVSEATQLYRRAITEPELVAALEERIARAYRPTPWSSTARAVLDALA
ncbi:glycosyltransferase family 4 protein [Falsiroseomonas oryziterrae]|uniref:glycosyltransferase family 4 protein n=1 Tax=Falsiroseomonas oryziterrae TaxID=2911368 RepID=UPI001F29599E|nr:glycosyltransferase family 1 protein [Roseomonas sp. NPKOSM-4]